MATLDEMLLNDQAMRRHMYDVPHHPGEVEISRLSLISPNNFSIAVDLQFVFSQIEIRENIFSPYVDGYITITDSVGLYERMPIIGEEFLHITFKTNGATSEDEIDKIFRVVKVSAFNQDPENPRVFVYTLEFKSIEYILNLKTKVQKTYKSKTTKEMAEDIYDNYIKNHMSNGWFHDYTKDFLAEDTSNDHNIVIPNMTPFDALTFLASRSKSADVESTGASFTFFESLKYGYRFQSIESLMQNPSTFSYFQAPESIPEQDFYKKFVHSSHNISEYSRISPIKVDENLKNGMYANRLIAHNMLRMKYDIHDLHYLKPLRSGLGSRTFDRSTGAMVEEDPENVLNDFGENISSYSESKMEQLVRSNVLNYYSFSNNSVVSAASDVLNSPLSNVSLVSTNEGCQMKFGAGTDSNIFVKDPSIRDNDIEHWYSRRKMQGLLLNSFIYNIKVKGNTHRSVGDIINLDIPTSLNEEINSASQLSSGLRSNTLVSGNFIVTRLSHVFKRDSASTDHILNLHIMRDSLSRKLPEPVNRNALIGPGMYTGDDPFEDQENNIDTMKVIG